MFGRWGLARKKDADGESSPLRPPPAVFQTSSASPSALVECQHCHQMTPLVSKSTKKLSASHTPSSALSCRHYHGTPVGDLDDIPDDIREAQAGALAAITHQANVMTSPVLQKKGKAAEKPISKYCWSLRTKKTQTNYDHLRAQLEADPSLIAARATKNNMEAPEGWTALMIAAKNNRTDTIDVMLEYATVEQLLMRNAKGQTAAHIAAEAGHDELALKLRVSDDEENVPVDILGRTPLGAALLSPAGQSKDPFKSLLFSPTDKSILGEQHPLEQRVHRHPVGLVSGMAHMAGIRVNNEDSVLVDTETSKDYALFGVFDGHDDGGACSLFVSKHVEDGVHDFMAKGAPVEDSFCSLFLQVDEKARQEKIAGGSTALVGLVTQDKIVVANTGDSRCILVQLKRDESDLSDALNNMSLQESPPHRLHAKIMSHDHKADLPSERERVVNAGCEVKEFEYEDQDGKTVVVHKLVMQKGSFGDALMVATTRSFGDFEYKQKEGLDAKDQAITALPEVLVHKRTNEDAFLILACDGIFDVMTNDQVARFVATKVEEYLSNSETPALALPAVGDQLTGECLKRQSQDNMSVVIVGLNRIADKIPAPSQPLASPDLVKRNLDADFTVGTREKRGKGKGGTRRGDEENDGAAKGPAGAVKGKVGTREKRGKGKGGTRRGDEENDGGAKGPAGAGKGKGGTGGDKEKKKATRGRSPGRDNSVPFNRNRTRGDRSSSRDRDDPSADYFYFLPYTKGATKSEWHGD